ncbi:hypothetical protein [Streptomyces sp. NPDC017941]|uniref:hypothetical protein n=1 Tax=Streptomyces sp. NPDC017941 TaxID=3365018 RepID=UPI0037A48A58
MSLKLWRGPDGQHWLENGPDHFDEEARKWVHLLAEAVQDPETGRWTAAPDARQEQHFGPLALAGYVEVSADPWAEPHVARLRQEVLRLLAEYERQAGQPYPAAGLEEAFEDVAALPEKLRNRGRGAAAQAAQSGFHRGQRSRSRR